MDDFLRSFKSVRDAPSTNKGFPLELHERAKELVKTSRHKYSVLPIIDIIIINLKRGKSIQDIKEGLVSISKYPLCLYLDQERPEFHQIRTFSGFYTYELKEKLDSFEQILEALGYRYDAPSQLYKLDEGTRVSPTFDDTIAKIGCDLVLALEELDLYIEMSKGNPIDPIVHFSSRVTQLQPNYEPAEIQYPNPVIPPRISNQQKFATQDPRNDTQNQFSNMPDRFQNPQAMHEGHIPESRNAAPNSYGPYRGAYPGPRMPYNPQDTNPVFRAPNQQHYQGQDQPYNTNSGYTKAGPFTHDQQTAPNYDARNYPHQGQVQQPYGPDPIPVQASSYARQEVTIRPAYTPNPGVPRQQGRDFIPPTAPGYGKSDPFPPPQAHQSQDPVNVNNYNHEYKQPMYSGRDPRANQVPYPNSSQDAYAPITDVIYANTSSYTSESAYLPGAGYVRTGANPEAVDIRYTHNPNSELAEVDALPPRRPKQDLAQGNKELSHPGNVHTSKSTDQLNIAYSTRDASITPIDQKYVPTPDTANIPQDFQLNSSRDANERNIGNQQGAMHGNRDAFETPNQTENFAQAQDSTGQTVFPRYHENKKLDIYSSTPRGVASPSVYPKNTHDSDEQTRDQSEDKSAFMSRAFAKSESSELHELDEKRVSREQRFSGVKEQRSNSPRQLSPKPENYSGKKEIGGLPAANTQPPYQQYGTQYATLPEEAGNAHLDYNHQYPQQPPANPGPYHRETVDPHRTDMSDHTRRTDMHMVNRPPEDYQGYNPRELTHPGQYEETHRPMPAPNISDYSQGVGSTRNPMNKATEGYAGYDNQEHPPANQGAYPIGETHRPMPAPNISDYSQGVGSTRNPMNKATEGYAGYDNQEHPPANQPYPRETGDPRRTDMSDYPRGTDMPDYTRGTDMHMANRPPEDYPRYNPRDLTPAIPGAYPGPIDETRRPVPASTDFSHGVDSTQHYARPEQPPTAQERGYTNDPYKNIDDGAYRDPYREELRHPRVPQYSPKDDFSQAVSDKNTGINDPNPVRNIPPVQYPRHQRDPDFTDHHDYRTAHHDDIPYGDDEIMMMEAPELMGMNAREREKFLRFKEQKNIAGVQRMRDNAGYDDPPYKQRQQHMDPTYHRPYEPPFQPPAPTTEWACPHCTYVNSPGIRVCTICSRTPGSMAGNAGVIPTGSTNCKWCRAINPGTARFCVECNRGLFD